jgi:hypothetical protein
MSHNFATTLDFLLVGGSFGLDAYLAFGPDRNNINARRQAQTVCGFRFSLPSQ